MQIAEQPVEFGIFAGNVFDKKYFDHLSTLKDIGFYNMGRNFTFRLTIPVK
jgi:iron complex outermembrane receptor protein